MYQMLLVDKMVRASFTTRKKTSHVARQCRAIICLELLVRQRLIINIFLSQTFQQIQAGAGLIGWISRIQLLVFLQCLDDSDNKVEDGVSSSAKLSSGLSFKEIGWMDGWQNWPTLQGCWMVCWWELNQTLLTHEQLFSVDLLNL